MNERRAPWSGIAFRQIQALAAVIELGSISAAGRTLGLAQSSVSRMLLALEEALGAKLHRRAGNATCATEAGNLLAPRFAYMAAQMRAAAAAPVLLRPEQRRNLLQFLADLTLHRAGQLLVLQDVRHVHAGATALNLSADAVRKMLRETRQRLFFPMFERREGGRLQATAAGELLLGRIRVLCREAAHAATDLAGMAGVRGGMLAVGCLPSVTASLLPAAVYRTLERHPDIHMKLAEGTYDELIHNLQSGYLDLVVGGLPPAARFSDLQLEPLFEDRLGVFARSGHPLAKRRSVRSTELARYRWVVPTRGAVAEPVLEVLLARAGIHPRLPHVEYASIVAVNGLLQSGDMLAVGSHSQLQAELSAGHVIELPCPLPAEPWPCGIISRAGAPPSVAMRSFAESLRAIIAAGAGRIG